MACREEKCCLPSSAFNPIKVIIDFKGQLIHIDCSCYWFWFWGYVQAQWKKGGYQLVMAALGVQVRKWVPMPYTHHLCFKAFLKGNHFYWVELYGKTVEHSEIQWFVFAEYSILRIFKFCFCHMVQDIRHDRPFISLIIITSALYFLGYKALHRHNLICAQTRP